MKYLMSENESDAFAALNKINTNCGFPNEDAQTWANFMKAYEQDIWFFSNPPPEGYEGQHHQFTYDQMIDGVVNVTESDGDSSWFPPAPPPD